MSKKKDFYYSAQQEKEIRDVGRLHIDARFKGDRYTECVDHGKPIISSFDDFVLVGTGCFSDCTYT